MSRERDLLADEITRGIIDVRAELWAIAAARSEEGPIATKAQHASWKLSAVLRNLAIFLRKEADSDALRAIASAPNQKVVIVPIEAAALAGTLGGIAELTRSVFGEGGGGSLPPTSDRSGRGGLPPRTRPNPEPAPNPFGQGT